MSKGKISVRRELREPDAFIKTTYSALDYVKKHRKLVSIVAVVLISLGVTAIAGSWYISDRDKNARQLLNQVVLTLEQDPNAAVNSTSEPLQAISTSYSSTIVGPVANYLSANQQYRAGQLDAAAKIYQNNKKGPGRHLQELQRFGIAAIHFQKLEYADCISILEKMQSEQSFLNEDLYVLLGLSYEKSKQPEKAVATYENMIQLLQNSFFKPWAEERLLGLRNRTKS
ncbi:tetratricopeptide repeat protein [bacterium]|nr:tetratricopeptide repeat protein [bacterium]